MSRLFLLSLLIATVPLTVLAAPFQAASAGALNGPPETARVIQGKEFAAARGLIENHNFSGAEQEVRRIVAASPESADAHFLLGYILFKEQRPKESLAEFTLGARYHTPGAADFKIIALDYVLLRDYADADKWLSRALTLDPVDANGWYYLGRIKYNENRFDDAVDAFQHCLQLDPDDIRVEDNLGLAYAGLDRFKEAVAVLERAIARQSGLLMQDPEPYLDLGTILIEHNQSSEAVTYLTTAAAIPASVYSALGMTELRPRVHERLASAFTHLQQYPRAQAELEEAVRLAPSNARLHYMLAQVYQKQGQTENAKAEIERFSRLQAGQRNSPQQ